MPMGSFSNGSVISTAVSSPTIPAGGTEGLRCAGGVRGDEGGHPERWGRCTLRRK